LDLRLRPHDEPGEREKAQTVAQALRSNATLKEARIRVFSQNGILFLEGFVRSSLQRNAAALAAMWAGRNFKIENKLRIIRIPLAGKQAPFIKVA
jgi:osmotically-inducible protein OsmY